MTRHIGHSGSCSCTNCVYKSRSQLPSVQRLMETGSKVDRLYYGKYLPLRERKLLGKLIRTRAVYDDVRTQLLSASGSSDLTKDTRSQDDDSTERSSAVTKIVDLVDRGQMGMSKLSNCCSCCSCSSMKKIHVDKHPRVHRHSVPHDAIAKYTLDAQKKGRARRNRLSNKVSSKLQAVRFKVKSVRSAPCACAVDITSMIKRVSKAKLKKSRSKEISTTTKAPEISVKMGPRALKCICKHPIKSLRMIKRMKKSSISGESEETTRKRFRIRKDSLMIFREKLDKKNALEDWECEPGICVPDKCVPEDCYENIKERKVGTKRKRISLNKLSSTDSSQSHVSISTKKRVSNVNVGKRMKKHDQKCMCPTNTNSSETTSQVTRAIKFKKKQPAVIGENIRLQTEKKRNRIKKLSYGKKQTKKQSKVQTAVFSHSPIINNPEELSQPISRISKLAFKKNIPLQKELQREIPKDSPPKISEVPQYTTEELESHPSRQAINIGSNFSFNVEFYKQRSSDIDGPAVFESEVIRKELYKRSPRITEERGHRIRKRQRSSQSISSLSKRSTNVGHGLKRCFCTLKIPKRKQKPHRPTSKKSMTSLYSRKVDVVGRMKETQTKSFKHRRESIPSQAKRNKPSSPLPHECECKNKVRVSNGYGSKYLSEVTNTIHTPKRSILTLTSQNVSNSSRKSQFGKPKYRNTKTKHPNTAEIVKSEIALDRSNRQGVRIGSSFSFNIEFSKERIGYETENNDMERTILEPLRTLEQPRVQKRQYREKGIKVHKPRRRHITSQTKKNEKSKKTYTKLGVDKCICPSNLLREKSTVTPLEYRQGSKVLMRHRLIATEKENKKHRHQATRLLSYECEPGVCIPDDCDPYECEKLIKMRSTNPQNRHKNSFLTPMSSKSRHSQFTVKRSKIHAGKGAHRKERDIIITPRQPAKQVVRMGSSFSFNIEFYKERQPADELKTVQVVHDERASDTRRHAVKRAKLKEAAVQNFERRTHHVSSNTEVQVREKGISVSTAIKRCFCTMKLHKKDNQSKNKKERNVAARSPEHQSTSTLERISNSDNSTKIMFKPKYCKADICDSHECSKETKQQHRKRIKYHHIDTDNNLYNNTTNPYSMRSKSIIPKQQEPIAIKYNRANIKKKLILRNRKIFVAQLPTSPRSTQPIPSKYNPRYMNEQQIMHRRIPLPTMRQAVRVGSTFDFNINISKQGRHRKPSVAKVSNSTPKDQPRRRSKKVKTKKPPEIKQKTCNVGPKLKNVMGAFKMRIKEIGLKIKKIKLRRSVSKYTMVRVKKPKPGEPVTAAFFQVIRDVDYKAMPTNIHNDAYCDSEYLNVISAREDKKHRVKNYNSKHTFHETYSATKDFSDGLLQENYAIYGNCYHKQNAILGRRQRDSKFPDNYLQNDSSKLNIRYDSCISFDIKSRIEGSVMNTFKLGQIRENKYKYLNNTQTIKSPFQCSYYALNLQVPNTATKIIHAHSVPGECNPNECNKLIKNKKIKHRQQSEGTVSDTLKCNYTKSNKKHNIKPIQSRVQATRSKRVNKHASKKGHQDNKVPPNYRQTVKFGSDISFHVGFYNEIPSGDSTVVGKGGRKDQVKSETNKKTTDKTQGHGKCKMYSETNIRSSKTYDAKDGTSLLERCFCILKVKKKEAGKSTENDKIPAKYHKINKNKGGISSTTEKLDFCNVNTCPDNKGNQNGKDTQCRRKRSKHTKVHSGKHTMSVKSDIPKNEAAKTDKRLIKSLECELLACTSNSFDSNKLLKKHRARSLNGFSETTPKKYMKSEGVANNNAYKSNPSLIKRCVCALTYRTDYNRNKVKQKEKHKLHKSKLESQLLTENSDLNKQMDVETIMPPIKKTLQKRGNRTKTKQNITAYYLHQSKELCSCINENISKDTTQLNKDPKQLDKGVNAVKNDNDPVNKYIKPTNAKHKRTGSKKFILTVRKRICSSCKLYDVPKEPQSQLHSTATPPPETGLKANTSKISKKEIEKDVTKYCDVNCQNLPPEIVTIAKAKDKNETNTHKKVKRNLSRKARVAIGQTERNGNALENNDKNCQCSPCNGGENNKINIKKRKKTITRNIIPNTGTSYHGLYPCFCSDKEINKEPSKQEGNVKEDKGLCTMCKHCEDKKPLWVTRLENCKLLMDAIKHMRMTTSAKGEARKPEPNDIPLFEMVVNKGDMSIMNKEHIMAKVKSSSDRHESSTMTPGFEMVISKNDASIMNTDKVRNKLMKNENIIKTARNKNIKSQSLNDAMPIKPGKGTKVKQRGRKDTQQETGSSKAASSYHGLFPCFCSDKEPLEREENLKEDDGLCPMCKHCEDKKPLWVTLLKNGKLLIEAMKFFLTSTRAKGESKIPESNDIPLFQMVVNKGDMNIMNKDDIIAKVKSSKDRRKISAVPPSFEIVLDKSDASFMNREVIRKTLMSSEKIIKTVRRKNIKSNSFKDEIPMKTPVKSTKGERQAYSFQIHGRNCKCCYCANKQLRKNDTHRKTGFSGNKAYQDGMPAYSKKTAKGPCICGSEECKLLAQQQINDILERKKQEKIKPCVCGSKICGVKSKKAITSDTRKAKSKKEQKKVKKENIRPKSQKPDLTAIGSLLCGRIDFNEFKYKITGRVETEHDKSERKQRIKEKNTEKEKSKRTKVYAKEDAKRRKARIKSDKSAMKDVKRYKDTPDCILFSESILDMGKLGLSAVSGVLRTTFRAIRDPKSTLTGLKDLASDPEHAIRTVRQTISDSGVGGTATRIKHRIGAMSKTQELVAKMESNPITNYMVHSADKDPRKRMVKKRKSVREPLDFGCSLFMGSMRKRPHLWVYYMCPWFYPHCVSLIGVWRQFTDVILFLLAVGVWSPCIFAMEACRALMCCFLCTG